MLVLSLPFKPNVCLASSGVATSSDKPFRIWNPNNSDDNRGYQKQSVCIVTEFVPN